MIPLYLCNAAGATVTSIDEQAVDTDLGVAYTARLVSLAWLAGAWSTLRRFTQFLFLGTSATVAVTPVVDGSEAAADRQERALDSVTDGNGVLLEVPLAARGTRHQIALEVTAHVGITTLGEWSRLAVPRRTVR